MELGIEAEIQVNGEASCCCCFSKEFLEVNDEAAEVGLSPDPVFERRNEGEIGRTRGGLYNCYY